MTSTISEFVWPQPALMGCVSGMLVRDTRGCGAPRANLMTQSRHPTVPHGNLHSEYHAANHRLHFAPTSSGLNGGGLLSVSPSD